LNLIVFYTIGNILKRRCLKWACMIHLSTYNTSYGRNKGQKSKCQLDSQPLKVKNRLDLGAYKGACHISLETFDKGYNFALNLTLIGGLHKKF
jgi:hypothetical protein